MLTNKNNTKYRQAINHVTPKEGIVTGNLIKNGINVTGRLEGKQYQTIGRWEKMKRSLKAEDAGQNYEDNILWPVVDTDNSHILYFIRQPKQNVRAKSVSRIEFLDILVRYYPKDFELVVWHPEVLEGRYDA